MVFNLHLLRGLSALMIVLVHLGDVEGLRQMPGFGRGGVDVFFVISGFIMVHVNKGRERSAARFVAQRIARIAPFYWTMTLVMFAVAVSDPALMSSTTALPGDLARSLLFIPFAKANGLVEPTLFVGWTLNCEMFFYAAFAVGLLRRDEISGLIVTGLILAGFIVLGFAAPDAMALRFYGSPISLEFLAGMMLGVSLGGPAARPAQRSNPAWLILAALAAFGCCLMDPFLFVAPGWILCGAPAIVLVLCALRLERSGWIVRHPVVTTLGDASFAIYLTHPFVLQAAHKIAAVLPSTPYRPAATIVGSFCATIAVGIAAHHWIERPLSSTALDVVRGHWGRPRSTRVPGRV